MKNKNIQLFSFLCVGLLLLASCKKDAENIFNMFTDVTVTFKGDHPFSVTDYKLVNDGDSVYIDYTITSAKEDMFFLGVEVVGATGSNGTSPTRTVTSITDPSERRSLSRVIKLRAQRDGKVSYRIYALNSKNIYIGDGYKRVTIDVRPSYNLISNRRIYAPDTTTRVNTSFYSFSRGQAFSFTDGQTNSANIDFGIWRRPDPRIDQAGQFIYNYYSLNAATNPFPTYDISTWTKRATVFSNPVTNHTNTFLFNLVSASTIEEQARTRTINVTSTNFTTWQAGLAPGNVIYFLTPEGKYGAFLVNAVTRDYDGKPYVNITVKMQK